MAPSEYLVVVEQYGPGACGAYAPELPGIGVAGEAEAEVRALVTDAIMLYLDELGQGENTAEARLRRRPDQETDRYPRSLRVRLGHEGAHDG